MKASRIVRIISYCLFGLITLFLVFNFGFNYFINKKLVPQLKEKFLEATNYQYILSFDKLSVNLFSKRISFDKLVIKPVNQELDSTLQFQFSAKYVRFLDYSLLSYFTSKKIEIDKIKIINAKLTVYTNDTISFKTLIKDGKISERIKSLSMWNIDIINYSIEAYRKISDKRPFFISHDNVMSLKRVCFNFETNHKDSFLLMGKSDVVLNKIIYHHPDSLYTFFANRILFSFVNSSLVLDTVEMIPNFDKKEFATREGYQINRVNIYSSQISMTGLNYKKLLAERELEIRKISIHDCLADVYRDNTKPLQKFKRPSLQSMIKRVPIPMNIDTILLNDGRLDFEVLNVGENTTGQIYMNKVKILISHITNDSYIHRQEDTIKAQITGYILNQARFTESYIFPLNSGTELFYCSGTLLPMPLSAFNSIVIPAKHLLFKSGQLDELKFSFCARENNSEGTMTFKYHDLKLEVVDHNFSKKSIKGKVGTFVLNRLMLHKDNPGRSGAVRTVKLYMKHNPYRYFLFYSMQTILSGIEPSIVKKKK